MTMENIVWTTFAWQILGAIDRGRKVDPDETYSHIDDGTLLDWLSRELGEDYVPFYVEDVDGAKARLLKNFSELVGVDTRRKFGVEHNGLCILLAFAVEMAQQTIARLEA